MTAIGCSCVTMARPFLSFAFQIDLRVYEQRLVTLALAFGLDEFNLKRPRIDLCDQVSLRDHLSFSNRKSQQFAIDAGPESYRLESSDQAEPVEVNRLVSRFRDCCNNRHSGRRRRLRSGRFAR